MIGILYLIYRKDSTDTKLELHRSKNYDLPIFREVMRDYGLEESVVEVICQAHSNPNLDIYFAETPSDLGNKTRIARGFQGKLENTITYLMYDSRLDVMKVQEFFANQYSGRPVASCLSNSVQLSYLLSDKDETFTFLSRNLPGDSQKQNVSIGFVEGSGIAYTSAVIQADELYLDAKHERMLMKGAFETARKYLDFNRLDRLSIRREYYWAPTDKDNYLWTYSVKVKSHNIEESRIIQIPAPDFDKDYKVREVVDEVFEHLAGDLEKQNYQRSI